MSFPTLEFIVCDLNRIEHRNILIHLMNIYRNDPMGGVGSMSDELAEKLVKDLKNHPTFMGFFVKSGEDYIAMANCFAGYSTFKAKPLLNIHDFIVAPGWRGQKVGEFLLNQIAVYLKEKGFCRINLEVRYDNPKAMNLYKRVGFKECDPPMYFWEKYL